MLNRRLAVLLRALTWIAAALVVAMPLAAWVSPDHGAGAPAPRALLAELFEDSAGSWIVLALIFPPYLSVSWGLVQLSGFCARLSRGAHFSKAAAASLKRFGWSLVAAALLLPFTRLLAHAYTMQGEGLWELSQAVLRTLPVLASALGLILGLIAIIFAEILNQATDIAEENARFV